MVDRWGMVLPRVLCVFTSTMSCLKSTLELRYKEDESVIWSATSVASFLSACWGNLLILWSSVTLSGRVLFDPRAGGLWCMCWYIYIYINLFVSCGIYVICGETRQLNDSKFEFICVDRLKPAYIFVQKYTDGLIALWLLFFNRLGLRRDEVWSVVSHCFFSRELRIYDLISQLKGNAGFGTRKLGSLWNPFGFDRIGEKSDCRV